MVGIHWELAISISINISINIRIIYSLLPGSRMLLCALLVEQTGCILEILIPGFQNCGFWPKRSSLGTEKFLEHFSG